jgi:hypothetical protein
MVQYILPKLPELELNTHADEMMTLLVETMKLNSASVNEFAITAASVLCDRMWQFSFNAYHLRVTEYLLRLFQESARTSTSTCMPFTRTCSPASKSPTKLVCA